MNQLKLTPTEVDEISTYAEKLHEAQDEGVFDHDLARFIIERMESDGFYERLWDLVGEACDELGIFYTTFLLTFTIPRYMALFGDVDDDVAVHTLTACLAAVRRTISINAADEDQVTAENAAIYDAVTEVETAAE